MRLPAPEQREQQILSLWERGAGLARFDREDALLAGMGNRVTALGARNAALLSLRSQLFDGAWPLKSCCPACGSDCEFEADSLSLSEALKALPSQRETQAEIAGRRVQLRAPTVDDLKFVAARRETASATAALLARCVSGDIALDDSDADVIAGLEALIERLDPGAVVSFALDCPQCAHSWSAPIDVGDALWTELKRAAERSLIEADALARAYGWTESEIFRLSPIRRAAYLQLIGA